MPMLNSKIETFIKVADAGSFNKAAEELFISPPAVIKQINSLELELEIELFNRNNRGLTLTEAGKSFYKDANYLLQYFNNSIERAKNVAKQNSNIIRIGTSPMTPGQFLADIWSEIQPYIPDMKFQLIPFKNTPEVARETRNFGRDIDMVVGVIDDMYLEERSCDATWLSDEPLCVGVPIRHPLYNKSVLQIEDLYNEKLMIINRNWNKHIDMLRDDVSNNYPQIHIVNFDFYGPNAYNICESENNLIITIARWKDVHPLMKVVPVEWKHSVPFGILHSQEPSLTVQNFLSAVKKVFNH